MNNELNLEEFFSLIASSSSRRLKLINDLNTLINMQELDLTHRFHFIRSSFPTLYSQYEGFTKDIFYNIPLYLKGIEKSRIFNTSLLALNISSLAFYMKDTNFLNFVDKINGCINSYYDNNTNYFNDYVYGKIDLPHDDKLFRFMELLNFSEDAVSKFKVSNQKIKTYYTRRNLLIHGSIDEGNSSGLHLSESFNDSRISGIMRLWNEQYEFTKEIITILKEETFNWLQEELYLAAQ